MTRDPKEAPPPDLPPAEHDAALELAEARRLEALKQAHGLRRNDDPAADLPKVHSEDD